MNEKQIAFVIASLLVGSLAVSQERTAGTNAEVRALLDQIAAYENLYSTVRLEWTSSAGRMQSASRIPVESDPIYALWIDRDRKRREETFRLKGEAPSRSVSVSNGQLIKSWTGDDPKTGQGVIGGLDSRLESSFQEYLFRPHTADSVFEYPEISILTRRVDTVALRFAKGAEFFIDATYVKDGPYLKVTNYQYHPVEHGKTLDGTEFRYEYGSAPGETLKPVKVEQISRIHGVHEVLAVTRVDFEPTFTDGDFTFSFPEGASVTDLRTGK